MGLHPYTIVATSLRTAQSGAKNLIFLELSAFRRCMALAVWSYERYSLGYHHNSCRFVNFLFLFFYVTVDLQNTLDGHTNL